MCAAKDKFITQHLSVLGGEKVNDEAKTKAQLVSENVALHQRVAELEAGEVERVRAEAEREKLIAELQEALSQVKQLSGLLPICASCKKIRNDQGYWEDVEVYVRDHSEAQFSHSICPECMKKLYSEFVEDE